MKPPRTRVIGLGNPLMGDDGIGIAALEQLRKVDLPSHIELIDAGCSSLVLLDLLPDCQKAVIIDAADFGAEPGTIKCLNPAEAQAALNPSLCPGSHQPGLAETLLLAEKLCLLPPLALLVMQVRACEPNTPLSTDCQITIPRLVKTCLELCAYHSSKMESSRFQE